MVKLLNAIVLLLLLTSIAPAQAQAPQTKDAANWDSLRFLLGEWIGEGTGAPGEGTGGFSFELDLQDKVIVRKNHADYPAAKEKPAYSHTDLMVIYREVDDSTKAMYFDNEGHVIHYSVKLSKDQTTLTFISDPSSA